MQQRQKQKRKVSAYWKLFNYGRSKDLLLLLLSLVSSAAHGVSTPLAVYLFGKLINAYEHSFLSPARASREVTRVVYSVLYVAAATLFSASAQVICSALVGERLASRLVINYFDALLSQEIGFHDLWTSTGDLVSGISGDIILVENAMGGKLAACVHSFSIFLAGSIILLSQCWSLGIIGLAVSPLLLAVGVAYVTFFSKYSAMVSGAYNDANQMAEQAFAQVRNVYASVGEITVLSRISQHFNNATRLASATGLSKGLGFGVACSIAYAAWAVQFAYASGLVQKGLLQAGTVFAMVTMSLYCGKALADCLQSLELVVKGGQAGAEFLEVLERKPTIDARVSGGHVPQKILGHIEFCNVSFAYPSAPDRAVFSNFCLEIPSGKTFAIVGTSGSGKSSLISLIERFYDPDKGEVRIDGTDIRKLQLKWLRNQIGLVSQEPLLFAMSIKQNIQLGKPHATNEEIQAAAKISNAHSFISDLPQGYETEVGNNLSGGQRQRLAIARAVLRDPAIMLLDEATSSLDPQSELLVQDALDKTVHGRTTLLIAHRLSTIMQADQIAVLHEGRVVEVGTHEQLMKKKGGRYAYLIQLQQTYNSTQQPVNKLRERSMSLDDDQSDEDLSKKTEVDQASFITWFFDCCSKARVNAIFASLGAVISGLLMAALPLLFSNVILAFVVRQEQKAELWIRGIGILAVVSLPSTILQNVCSYKSGATITQQVQESALTAILKNEVGWFDSDENNSIGITAKLSRNSATIRNTMSDTYSSFLQNGVAVCAALVLGYFCQWKMALLSSLMLPVYVLGNAVSHKYLGDEESQASYSSAIRVIGEAVSSLRTVQSLSSEEELSSNVRKHLTGTSREKLRRATIAGTVYGVSQGVLQAANALIMWYGTTEVMRGREDMASTLTSFTVVSYTSHSCIELLKLVPELCNGVKAVKSMFHYSSRRTLIDPDQPDARDSMELKGGIEFQNVSFVYPTRPDKMVLNSFSLKIKAGSTVVFVGRSGCGKSSVLALLQRFYESTNGRLLMDGRDIKLFNLRSLRRQIGYVQQEPVLLAATIRENITFGCDRVIGETELIQAATLAGAHGFISGLPQGYETEVGERCIQLSGGQRQRLAIARAIVRKPAILMLDEATSALDAETEKLVNAGLQTSAAASKSTVVVVAHRLSVLSSSEGATVVVMDGGRAVECGSHFELLERGGAYSRLITGQCPQM